MNRMQREMAEFMPRIQEAAMDAVKEARKRNPSE